jgi:DNA repair exonuclease SbcCD ATPase subunit
MIEIDSALVELKSQRAQIEIQLLGMRLRLNDLDEARARELRAEIERAVAQLAELEQRVERIESGDLGGDDEDELATATLQTSAELDQVRTQILDGLRALAEPLRVHAELAERQRRLAGKTRELTGKDNSYQAYIDTALLRTSDIDETLELVLETIRKTRPVA